MWPFKKRSSKTNVSDPLTIREPLSGNQITFEKFGNSSVTWLPFLTTDQQQNNFLLIDYFNTLSEVSAPIRKYSDQAKHVVPYIVDKNGEKIEGHEALPIFEDYWEKSAELLLIYDLLLGNAYVDAINSFNVASLTRRPTELYLLPSEYVKIKLNEEKDIRLANPIKYIVEIPNYNTLIIEPENILHLKTPSFLYTSTYSAYGVSRLVSCVKNIQAIASGYGAKVSLYDNGPRGFITGKRKGEYESVNEDETNEELQQRINDRYGRTRGQYQWLVTKSPLDVTSISMNVGELQINENNASDFRRICNALNQDSKIHGDPEATTYDNMQTALSDFANAAFKSKINSLFQKHTEFLNKWWPDITILPDFRNIKEIREFEQENELKLFGRVEKGLMTRNQYNEAIGEPLVDDPSFDEYYTFYNGQWYPVINEQNDRETETIIEDQNIREEERGNQEED